MKKYYLFILGIIFLIPNIVLGNEISNIDMSIYIDNIGTAHVTEIWNTLLNSGTEGYKPYYNLGNSQISNFKVFMNNKEFTYKNNYDINASFDTKKYTNGFHYINDGIELCFGISEYGENKYTLTYDISNFAVETSDKYQMVYWTLFPHNYNPNPNRVHIKIYSDFKYDDTLAVWGYGKYKMPAYVYDGYIEIDSENKVSSNEYITVLVKFPENTFELSIKTDKTFNDYLNMANEGATVYKKSNNDKDDDSYNGFLSSIISFIIYLALSITSIASITIVALKYGYGYKDNKIIDKKNTPFFRDIPCNKDIYLADAFTNLNKKLYSDYKETNIFGAILLKWLKQDKIKFIHETKGIFNRETSSIDLRLNPIFDDEMEKKLFDYMYKASKDGILETKELEKWCKNNYSTFFELFKKINTREINKLKEANHIYKRVNKEECKKKTVMDDYIYDESVKLYGLKKFLDEFSKIDTKEAIEVKLWDEYLMFAYIFGIADKVAEQFKNLYPEILNNHNNQYYYDYSTLLYISHISNRSVSAASSARAKAQSYSSGGGGFSSGGGGGGSFGGGHSGGGGFR